MPSDVPGPNDRGELDEVDAAARRVAPPLVHADLPLSLSVRHLLLWLALTFVCLVVLGDSTSDRSLLAILQLSAAALVYGAALTVVALLITWRQLGRKATLQPGEWLASLVAVFALWHLVGGSLTYLARRGGPPPQQMALGICLIMAHCLAAVTVLALACAANTPRPGRKSVGIWKWLLNFGLAELLLSYLLRRLLPAESWGKTAFATDFEVNSVTFNIHVTINFHLTNFVILIGIVAISLAIFLWIFARAVWRDQLARAWLHAVGLAAFTLYVLGQTLSVFAG